MAKKVSLEVEIENGSIDETGEKFVRLERQIKETRIELQKAAEAGDTVKFNQLKSQLDGLEDNLEKVRFQSKEFHDALATVPGPAGRVGQAIQGLDGAFKMLVANPIVATIAVIGAVLFTMYQALTKTKEGTAALSKMTEAFGNILTPIIKFISAVAVPVVETFAKALNTLAVALGLVDEQQVKSQQVYRDFEVSVKKTNAELENEIALLEAQGKEIDKTGPKKIAQLKNEIALLEVKKKAVGELTAEEEAAIIAANGKIAVIKAQILKYEQDQAKERLKNQYEFRVKKKEIEIAAINDEEKKAIETRKLKLDKDLKELREDKEFIKLKATEKAKLEAALTLAYKNDINEIGRDADKRRNEEELILLQAQQKSLQEGSKAWLDNAISIEQTAFRQRILNAKGNAEMIEALTKEHEQNKKNIQLQAFIAEKQIQLERLAVIGSIGASLAQLAGKNKKLAIAALVIEKAAAIGQIWANNAIANAKAVAASPLTFGQPWVTVNTVAAGLSTAATVAAAAKAISEINSQNAIPGSGGSGGGSASAPSVSNIGQNQLPAPQIGPNVANPQNQLSQMIGQSVGNNINTTPIKAYVLSSDVKTASQFDRRIMDASKIG